MWHAITNTTPAYWHASMGKTVSMLKETIVKEDDIRTNHDRVKYNKYERFTGITEDN